jgi:hypothetical protein
VCGLIAQHLWTELSALQKHAVQGNSDMDMLASSLAAAKAELDAANKRADTWQTKASMSERTCAAERQEHQAASAANKVCMYV